MNKNILIISFILFFSACGNSQPTSNHDTNSKTKMEYHISIRDTITNTKTQNHILIQGTRLFLIPPADYKQSNLFIGISKGNNCGVWVMDIPSMDYYSKCGDMTRENFQRQGAKIFEFKEFRLNGYSAKFMNCQGNNPQECSMVLIFGDSSFMTTITCVYPSTDLIAENQIKKCLLSCYYDKSIKTDFLSLAKFEFGVNNKDFKFCEYAAGNYRYSTDSSNNKNRNVLSFQIMQMPYEQATNEILTYTTNQMIEKAKLYSTSNLNFESKLLTVNDYNAMESVANFVRDGEKNLYYILVVGKQNNISVIVSIIQNDIDIKLAQLKKYINTIKLK